MAYILLTFCDTSLHVYGTTVAAYDTVVRLSVVTYCTGATATTAAVFQTTHGVHTGST